MRINVGHLAQDRDGHSLAVGDTIVIAQGAYLGTTGVIVAYDPQKGVLLGETPYPSRFWKWTQNVRRVYPPELQMDIGL